MEVTQGSQTFGLVQQVDLPFEKIDTTSYLVKPKWGERRKDRKKVCVTQLLTYSADQAEKKRKIERLLLRE